MQDLEKTRAEIKMRMTQNGINATALAAALGVSVHSVYGWMTKNNIPKKQLKRIFEVLPAPEIRPMRPIAVALSETDYEKCLEAAKREGYGDRVDLWGGKMLAAAAERTLSNAPSYEDAREPFA